MAAKKTGDDTAGKSPPKGRAWSEIQKQAEERPDIFPRLQMGASKTAEGYYDVEILEDEPRSIVFEDRFNDGEETPGLAINVRVLGHGGSFTEAKDGDFRSIVMRDDPQNGLTAGIGKAASRNGGKLKGVRVRIEARNYTHKVYGPGTRGYTVTALAPATNPTGSPP